VAFGIAFEGCACKGAFHVGVAEWMHDHGYEPDVVAGASSGSVIAALVALGEVKALAELWLAVGGTAVFQPKRMLAGRWPFVMSEVVGVPLRRKLGAMLLADVPKPLAITVTVLRRRGLTRRILSQADPLRLADAVLASCFFPGPYSRMVPVDGRPAIDGAWHVRTPVDAVEQLGADKQIGCVTRGEGTLRGGFVRKRVFDVPAACRILRPIEPLQLDTWELDRRRIEDAMALGRRSAEAFFEANGAWLRQEPPEARRAAPPLRR